MDTSLGESLFDKDWTKVPPYLAASPAVKSAEDALAEFETGLSRRALRVEDEE